MSEPIQKARSKTITRLIAVHFTLTAIVNLVFFAGNTFRPLASATGGLFTGSLLANLVFIGVLVILIILRFGGLRPYDVGFIPRHIPYGIFITLSVWGAAQLIHLTAGFLMYGSVALSSEWVNPAFMIGMMLTQIFGNALFEEIAYRGFMFPQLYLRMTRLKSRPWARLALALLISQGLFALSHIPNRIYLGMKPNEIAIDLLMLLGWGTLYTLIYLRTDNLFIVVGIHALGNTPTTLFRTIPLLSGDGASILIYTLVIFFLFGLPLLRARRQRVRLHLAVDTGNEALDGEAADDIDPFDDFGTEIDDSDIDSLRISDTDDPFDNDIPDVDVDDMDDDAPKRPKQAGAYSPRPTPGQIVSGVIQVILFAAIFLLIFLAVGFGAVFGGQKVGLVATRAPGGSGPLMALLPTAGAAQPQTSGDQATAAPGVPTTAPTIAPTTDASCASATDWWNSQQVKDNYQYFAAAAINDARNSDRISALLEQLRIKRNFVDSFQLNGKPLDACLNDAKAALLKGFDATIEAVRAIGAKDDAALTTQQANATQAFNDMATVLRKYGVAVDLGTTGT